MCQHRRIQGDRPEPIHLTLSPTQVDEVLRAASEGRAPGVSSVIAASLHPRADGHRAVRGDGAGPAGGSASPTARLHGAGPDRRLSRSLQRGLSVLACFGASGEERGVVELSRELDMSASTAHRYVATLVELGLLERCPRSRKYRLPEALTR